MPDTLFKWLCSVSSFRFIDHSGRFTASREGQRSWRAYRTFHGQNHKQSLGTTDRLAVARLEKVAGMLQARLTKRSGTEPFYRLALGMLALFLKSAVEV